MFRKDPQQVSMQLVIEQEISHVKDCCLHLNLNLAMPKLLAYFYPDSLWVSTYFKSIFSHLFVVITTTKRIERLS